MRTLSFLLVPLLAWAIPAAAANEPAPPGMVRIGPGTFVMGSDEVLLGERPTAHRVTISGDFFIGATEVTVAEYRRFDPTKKGAPRLPVVTVSWDDAQAYVAWLNESSPQRSAYRYRLCTEAEWEFAARAGTSSVWTCGDDPACLNEVAWFADATWELMPVKMKQPNRFGLYDMIGNAAEWVADYHADYDLAPQVDPTGPPNGARRVIRGGRYHSPAKHLRAASRASYLPGHADAALGFRVCASAQPSRWTAGSRSRRIHPAFADCARTAVFADCIRYQ